LSPQVSPSFGTSSFGLPPRWEGVPNDCPKIPDNYPFPYLSCCHRAFSRLFKFCNLCSGEVLIQENPTGEGKQLPLSLEGAESIGFSMKLEEESGVVTQLGFFQSYIKEAKGILKEPSPHFHRIQRGVR